VHTTDGRELTGEVDVETDDTQLWVRQTSERIVLTTSVPWSSIASASQAGKMLPQQELPTILRKQATSSEPVGFLVQQTAYQIPTSCQGNCLPQVAERQQRRVHSLGVEAFLVNLDRDVEPDGLELLVAALDEQGIPIAVRGSLDVRLWGQRFERRNSQVRFEDLQQWAQPVARKDFVDGVASYALRFRGVQPQRDAELRSGALANVRLGVFGEGNFSASVPVRIREFNPVRDQRQIYRGTRFFPGEITAAASIDSLRSDSRRAFWTP